MIVADDEPEIRSLLKEMIHAVNKNVFVIEAVDGADAIRKIKLQKFSLAILDLKMPKFDGEAVLNGIKLLPLEYKPEHILIVSSLYNEEQLVKEHGAALNFIPKPFKEESIKNFIAKIFNQPVESKGSASAAFDINIVNAFIDATNKVLETMAQTPSVKDSLYLRDPNAISGDISAILSIHSSTHNGSLAISFGKDCFLAVVNKMLGENYKEINPENSDAVAELCNQIFGIAKKELNANGHDLQMAIPSVVTGDSHKILHKTSGPCVVVKFMTPNGYFTIETVMEKITSLEEVAA